MKYELLELEHHDRAALLRLHRPEALNALSLPLREELRQALVELEADARVGAIVITGDDKAFAAGADVKTLSQWSLEDVAASTELRGAWEQLARGRKTVIAAVAGLALGAGCELAMMCDFILAADTAKFGQPEIKLGTIPGSGGTQRLTLLVGRSKAMEMILTGRMMEAEEAERCGLVARIVPAAELIGEALRIANQIARFSAPVVERAREAVRLAEEMPLADGLRAEQRLFDSTFALADRAEGMHAFLEKRKPVFTNR